MLRPAILSVKPLLPPSELQDAPCCQPRSTVPAHRVKVTIVEDNPDVRTMLAQIISDAPSMEVLETFSDGEAALAGIPRQVPDVIIMDIQLPNLSGVECTRALKLLLPELQIVVFTVFADADQILRALKAGASGYLLKRSSPEEVITAVEQMLQGGAPMSPGIARKVVEALRAPARSSGEEKQKMWRLTPREAEILDYLAKGYSGKEMAARIGVEEVTIRFHLRNIYAKLHVRSRTEAIANYLK